MGAKVMRVLDVWDHPERPAVSVVRVDGAQFVADKLRDGSAPPYATGDLVVFVDADSVVPAELLRGRFWNAKEDRPGLYGTDGDQVRAGNHARVRNDGIHFPVQSGEGGDGILKGRQGTAPLTVREGDDVAEYLGITRWEG